MSNRPIKTFSSGKVSLSIWQGEYNGQPTYSYSFQKSYIDKNKQWQNTNFLSITDIPNVITLCWKIMLSNVKEKRMNQSQNQAQGLQNSQYQQNNVAQQNAQNIQETFGNAQDVPF